MVTPMNAPHTTDQESIDDVSAGRRISYDLLTAELRWYAQNAPHLRFVFVRVVPASKDVSAI